MPSPSTQRGLLSLPFRTGLSQKQDERWLEQGAMFSAENVVKKKTNTFEKRVGFTALGTTSFAIGRSLATFQGSLLAIGKDQWTDAAWSYNEIGKAFQQIDRIPEVYV